MDDPYKSPVEVTKHQQPPNSFRFFVSSIFAFGGLMMGVVVDSLFARSEAIPYYSIRSYLTGCSDIPRILTHPLDYWIVAGVFVFFYLGGPVAGWSVGKGISKISQDSH